MHLSSPRPLRRRAAGFTLIELLVTLVIVSVGILGLVKLEAAAVSESQVSRVRSLMTFQAESLAGAMRANRGYWSPAMSATSSTTLPSFTFDGSTVPSNVSGATDCTSKCSTSAMALADLKAWVNAYSIAFPGARASIACSPTGACVTDGSVPASYDIKLTWDEKTVATSRTATSSTSSVSMVLHVQP